MRPSALNGAAVALAEAKRAGRDRYCIAAGRRAAAASQSASNAAHNAEKAGACARSLP